MDGISIPDPFSGRYVDLLDGIYDCVDRIVLNAYFYPAQSPGGFRNWWRLLFGDDGHLDDTHLMRFAGHFARRVAAFAKKTDIPLIFSGKDERKEELAAPLVPSAPDFQGLFCIVAGRAPAPVRRVKRFQNGCIDIGVPQKYPYVNHYLFHLMDKHWGHVIIRFCPHPPFNAQILLNGHEYVARQALATHIPFTKQDNCFTGFSNAADLAQIAETMSAPSTVGRMTEVCERWIYSTCLCFALSMRDQERTGFKYGYSVYQLEYSRNLLFTRGRQMEQVFDSVIDRTRATLNIRTVRTIFGRRSRPYQRGGKRNSHSRMEVAVEKPAYNLTVFKIHFGLLTVKIYSKGERVLRIEAIAHNAKELGVGKRLEHFPEMALSLKGLVERFLEVVHSVAAPFVTHETWESLTRPSPLGSAKIAGVDFAQERMRAAIRAVMALSLIPKPFRVAEHAALTQEILDGKLPYSTRQASYDLKKLRAKGLLLKCPASRAYQVSREGLSMLAAVDVLYNKVIGPLLAAAETAVPCHLPEPRTKIDDYYGKILSEIQGLCCTIGMAA